MNLQAASGKITLTLLALALASSAAPLSKAAEEFNALPIPKSIRVASSAPLGEIWDGLTKKQQKLATHLIKASEYGRTLVCYQNHRHGLALKAVIEGALGNRKNQARTKALLGEEGFQEFLGYGAKFEDLCGPYAVSFRKYVLKTVTPEQARTLIQTHQPKLSDSAVNEITWLLTDPTYEVIQRPDDHEGKFLEISGGNLYEKGITQAEFKKSGLATALNCRVARDEKGQLYCQIQSANSKTADPVVVHALTQVIGELARALPYAQTDHQFRQINHLIQYLKTGALDEFEKFNIEWVLDGTDSTVDFMMGYVETYQDHGDVIGSWESYVQILNPKTTAVSSKLASFAQDFESQMPYEPQQKKTFDPNRKAPALVATYFQEITSGRSSGYNLPNDENLRNSVGFKNIIRAPLPGEGKDPSVQKLRLEAYQEFAPASRVAGILAHRDQAVYTLVLLHEIIGHGSGLVLNTKGPSLGGLGSSLEEQRADLAALAFADHKNLVEAGVYANAEEALQVRNALYDFYVADLFLRLSKQQSFNETHELGRWLFINQLIESGAVRYSSQDEKSPVTPENAVLLVTNYQKFQDTARASLKALQDIKAYKKAKEMTELFEKYAPSLESIAKGAANGVPDDQYRLPLLQGVIKRGPKLAINAGAIQQPWIIQKPWKYTNWIPYVGHDARFKALGELNLESAALYWKKASN